MENLQNMGGQVHLNDQAMQEKSFEVRLDTGNAYIPGQPHTHEYYELLCCRSSCGAEVVCAGQHYRLQRGDILLISPNTPHGFLTYSKTGEPYSGYILWVSGDYMAKIEAQADYIALDHSLRCKQFHTWGTHWEHMDVVFRLILQEAEGKDPGWEAALFGTFLLLMVQIRRAGENDPSIAVAKEKKELLAGILAYVENNLSEKITLEDVANRFFVSASTITHLFTKRMEISFYKYVMQRRLENAKNLISEGMPMERVALKVGFGDYSAFYRAFRQEFGMSPRQFYKRKGG